MVRYPFKEVEGIPGFVTRMLEQLLARMKGEDTGGYLFSNQLIMKLNISV